MYSAARLFLRIIKMQRFFESIINLKKAIPCNAKFALVGGAFDLLHPGHIHLFEYAQSLEDLLVVCVLSDSSIRGYKNSGRPIQDEKTRLRMVASIRYVDFAYLSDESPSSISTLSLLQPHSVVFGNQDENKKNVERWQNRIEIYSPYHKD